MDRRRFLAIAGSALLAGCGQGSDSNTTDRSTDRPTQGREPSPTPTATARPRTSRTSSPTPSPTRTPTSAPTRTPASAEPTTAGGPTRIGTPPRTPASSSPVAFSGRGNSREDGLDVVGGLTVVEGVYRGSGEFTVTLDPADGGRARRVVDASGPYSGVSAGLLESGTYALEVVAERTYWRLTIRQPRPGSGRPLPAYFDREGPGVFGPYGFGSDTATAAASHVGTGPFIVEVMDPAGEFPTVMFDREGSFTGETTFDPPDIGFVNVPAGGNWTLSVRDG